MVFIYILIASYAFFVPGHKEFISNGTFSAEVVEGTLLRLNQSSPMLLPAPVTPLQSTTTPGFVEMVWKGNVSWVPDVLHMVLGYALRTILNQRRQLDHEQEVRQEQQGHHLLSGNNGLPAPIASASTVEGFKTETEIRRLRLRVPTWPRLVVGVWFLFMALDSLIRLSPSLQFYSGMYVCGIECIFSNFGPLTINKKHLACSAFLTDPPADLSCSLKQM